jgi:hypothetical protein
MLLQEEPIEIEKKEENPDVTEKKIERQILAKKLRLKSIYESYVLKIPKGTSDV